MKGLDRAAALNQVVSGVLAAKAAAGGKVSEPTQQKDAASVVSRCGNGDAWVPRWRRHQHDLPGSLAQTLLFTGCCPHHVLTLSLTCHNHDTSPPLAWALPADRVDK